VLQVQTIKDETVQSLQKWEEEQKKKLKVAEGDTWKDLETQSNEQAEQLQKQLQNMQTEVMRLKKENMLSKGFDSNTIAEVLSHLGLKDQDPKTEQAQPVAALTHAQKIDHEKTLFVSVKGGAQEKDLWDASNAGDVKEVKKLLAARADPNWQNAIRFGSTCLTQASKQSHVEVVTILVKSKAHVESTDKVGCCVCSTI